MSLWDRIRGNSGGGESKKAVDIDLTSALLARARQESQAAAVGTVGGTEMAKKASAILDDLGDKGLVEGVRVTGKPEDSAPKPPASPARKVVEAARHARSPVSREEAVSNARGRLQERQKERADRAAGEDKEDISIEDMGGTVVDEPEPFEEAVAGGRGETTTAAPKGDDTIERKQFPVVKVVKNKAKPVDRRASDGYGRSRDSYDEDDSAEGTSVLSDKVAEHLIDFTLDPPDKNLPLVTILPPYQLAPIVMSEVMSSLPYRSYIGRNEARREKAIQVAKGFNAPLFLLKRRDVRAIGVKGKGREDAVAMFQTKAQEAQMTKPLFPEG